MKKTHYVRYKCNTARISRYVDDEILLLAVCASAARIAQEHGKANRYYLLAPIEPVLRCLHASFKPTKLSCIGRGFAGGFGAG